jgi:hypothetical protein
MGAGGVDVKLSEAAYKLVPYAIECKSLKTVAVYKFYEQAQAHKSGEPLVVVKANQKSPLAIMDLDHFLDLLKRATKNG